MKEYVGIYITEKSQEQDGFGNKMKYHFYITTIHKYYFFVFCLYSSCVYLCRVVMWKWYFILLPKSSYSCAFSVLIYIPTYSFIFKNVFDYSSGLQILFVEVFCNLSVYYMYIAYVDMYNTLYNLSVL